MIESQSVGIIMFFICLLIILIAIGVFYLYSSLNKYNSKIQKEGVKRVYNKLNERYLEKNQLQNKLLSEMWHDMNNHINTLKLMSSSENNDSLNYLNSIENKIKRIPNIIKTGNNLADIIFNEKYSEAFLHNIDFDVKSVLPPMLSIDNTDFSSILFNTIDNAIEANMNVESEDKHIYIEMYPKGNFLFYKIKNTYNSEINKTNPKKAFRKKDYISPGYGISIVNDIIYKLKGNIKIDNTHDEFTVTILLRLND
jgi:sensor histidine kinase regulating citrate/malate metabolism